MPNSLKQQNAILQNKVRRLATELERERALWKSPATKDRLARSDPGLMHRLETLDGILSNRRMLKANTGLVPDEFSRLLGLFVREIKRRREAPLFRDGEAGTAAPGNRCSLERRHALLLTFMRRKTDMTQGQLAALFGVDQSAVCRYLALCEPILEGILSRIRAGAKKPA